MQRCPWNHHPMPLTLFLVHYLMQQSCMPSQKPSMRPREDTPPCSKLSSLSDKINWVGSQDCCDWGLEHCDHVYLPLENKNIHIISSFHMWKYMLTIAWLIWNTLWFCLRAQIRVIQLNKSTGATSMSQKSNRLNKCVSHFLHLCVHLAMC